MADSDGPSTEPNDPRYVAPPALKPLAPAPRVNPPNINSQKDAPPAAGPQGFHDFLEWMRAYAGGGPADPATQRTVLPKEKKKFQRRDAEGKAEPAAPATPVSPVPPADTTPGAAEKPAPVADAPTTGAEKVVPAKSLPVPPEPLTPRVRRQQDATKRSPWIGLLTQLGFLLLLVGSFVLGRITVPKVAAPHVAPAAPEIVTSDGKVTTKLLSDANAALIDQAMAAEQRGEFKRADELLLKVKASGEHVNGLSFQLAQVAAFQNDFNRALPLLNESLSEGEYPGEVYNLRATLSNRRAAIRPVGMIDYETATKVEPFEPRNFFYWGEALRRAGKDQAALVRLQEALDRLREPALESLYRLKIRLAQIELGQENDFADDLARQLASPNPEMDWLVTAAALEMHRANFAAAAGYLDRAARSGNAEIFASRLRDYYLYQFKFEKELARFYAKEPAVKPGAVDATPPPADSPQPEIAAPAIGLDVPDLPPPASPGVTLPH